MVGAKIKNREDFKITDYLDYKVFGVYSSGGEDYIYPDGHMTYTFKAEDKFFKPGFVKIENKTISEDLVLFDRPVKKSVRYYETSNGDQKVTEYTLEIDNINGPRHYIGLTMDDTNYTNTEEIFDEIVARIKLGPIPEEDQQVIPVPPEFYQES